MSPSFMYIKFHLSVGELAKKNSPRKFPRSIFIPNFFPVFAKVWFVTSKMSVTLSAFYLISLMSTCWTAGDQVPIRGKALRGHTYKTAKAGELFRCYMCCERDPACKSCNFKHTKEICEMNNETKATKPNDFITDEQSYYIRRPGGGGYGKDS